MPKEARWAHLQANAKLPSIGKDVYDAMVALERDNPRLKGLSVGFLCYWSQGIELIDQSSGM